MSPSSPTVHVLKHSLAEHHLSRLRSVDTVAAQFRLHVNALATLLAAEVTRNLALQDCTVTTPLETVPAKELSGRIAAIPILRAGLGMVTPMTELIPDIEVWHLGLYRDEETAKPVRYYDNLPPDRPTDTAIVLDPMLATGGSAVSAIETVRDWGVRDVRLMTILSAPEGIAKVTAQFPDVPIYTCAIDRELNDRKFILPGLGDAGDRIFNTEQPDESQGR
ncbi:uracil phosphoribosyltransferase [Fuerstiella marisgermanici]|uniref:Uracil phosphoribosyltransferase n=1 Tax=Fuerstiella marisgermanici TaxID=1891926 RepID=A0A1P8WID1_9PLAN|nr:uracil phosphoribosyltransferase [Fuerstiella marisgermanici]APZ93816.1 Uracil phosphoribosyltransferase [Fuerstiella marisgermanici]